MDFVVRLSNMSNLRKGCCVYDNLVHKALLFLTISDNKVCRRLSKREKCPGDEVGLYDYEIIKRCHLKVHFYETEYFI